MQNKREIIKDVLELLFAALTVSHSKGKRKRQFGGLDGLAVALACHLHAAIPASSQKSLEPFSQVTLRRPLRTFPGWMLMQCSEQNKAHPCHLDPLNQFA